MSASAAIDSYGFGQVGVSEVVRGQRVAWWYNWCARLVGNSEERHEEGSEFSFATKKANL